MHWYTTDGTPAYEIESSSGKGLRPTTLRDAKKEGYVPSVTTVLDVKSKGQLSNWLVAQGIIAALNNPIKIAETEKEYVDRIVPLSKAKTFEAARRGNEIHNKLESYFLGTYNDKQDSDRTIIKAVIELLDQEFDEIKWSAEDSFAHISGFGGKVDLHSQAVVGDDHKEIILDFKTKAKDYVDSKMYYFDYCIQLAAYRLGLNMKNAECYNLIISTTNPGSMHLHKWSEKDLVKGLAMFQHLLAYWQLENNYDSSFGGNNE